MRFTGYYASLLKFELIHTNNLYVINEYNLQNLPYLIFPYIHQYLHYKIGFIDFWKSKNSKVKIEEELPNFYYDTIRILKMKQTSCREKNIKKLKLLTG